MISKSYTAPQALFAAETAKTYAPHRVRKGSTRCTVKGVPMSRKEKAKLYHEARRWERGSAASRRGACFKVSTQGRLGRSGIDVYRALLFDFHNEKSGRCDPSYRTIAEKVGCCVRTVARALARLKIAGLIDWLPRCSPVPQDDGGFLMRQDSNWYGVNPQGQWRGYRAPPAPPPPDPEAWGKTTPLPALGVQAGDGPKAIQTILDGGGGDSLAKAMAKFGRRLGFNGSDSES